MPDAKREPTSIVLHPMSEAPRDKALIIAMHIEGDKPRMKIIAWSDSYSIHGLGGHWTEAGIGGQYGDMHFAGWLPIETDMEWPADQAAATFAGAERLRAENERLTRRNAELTDSEERMASATRIAESHRRMVCKLAADREAERDTLQARVAELERERDEACRILSLYRVFAQFEFDELRAAMKHLTPAAPGSE